MSASRLPVIEPAVREEPLADYAMRSAETRGRVYPIEPDRFRTDFQRDRDRIIHCEAFRRLEYKTQVYVIHEGDYYRTRLTHTLEVAQIARTLAAVLGLNQELTEAIALAHDLGHTPFGHSGESALQKLRADSGGFEHNQQSLRVIEVLERRFHQIPGLNLTWEIREGVAKHTSAFDQPVIEDMFEPSSPPTLEAQICDLADEIAYNHHDIDDALEMGLLREDQFKAVDWIWQIFEEQRSDLPSGVSPKIIKYRVIGQMMDLSIGDVVDHTRAALERHGIGSVADVRNHGRRLADFSPAMKARQEQLRAFLMENVYRHPHVLRMQAKAERFVTLLFELFRKNPALLPREFQARIDADGLDQVITDYVCGMTDHSLLEEYAANFEPTLGHRRVYRF